MSGRANTGNCFVPRKSRVRSQGAAHTGLDKLWRTNFGLWPGIDKQIQKAAVKREGKHGGLYCNPSNDAKEVGVGNPAEETCVARI